MTGLEGIEPTNKHNIANCIGCKYLSAQDWCNYREMTGRSRLVDGGPLHPDGGCSLYTKGRMRKSNESPWGRFIRYDRAYDEQKERAKREAMEAKRRAKRFAQPGKYDKEIEHYYEMGLSDKEIARRVGCGHTTVFRWRHKHELESNFRLDRARTVENDKNL